MVQSPGRARRRASRPAPRSTSQPRWQRAGCWRRSTIPIPRHLLLTGTGLTHLGSAEGRDKMHKAAALGREADRFDADVPDGRRGRQARGRRRSARSPNGSTRATARSWSRRGAPLISPAFAQDGGEEPEIAGDLPDRPGRHAVPPRLLRSANEFSDHVTERGNYLWLAHSKLRPAALGPELLIGDAAGDMSRARRRIRARRRGGLGEAVPVGRGQHVPHASPTSSTTISSTTCSAARATCTSISSAPRRCRSRDGITDAGRATCSRSRPTPFRCRCATRWRTAAAEPVAVKAL